MPRWKLASVVVTLLYVLLVMLRSAANAMTHIGIDGNRDAFVATVRWYTVRDIAVLTVLYGVALAFLLRRKRRG